MWLPSDKSAESLPQAPQMWKTEDWNNNEVYSKQAVSFDSMPLEYHCGEASGTANVSSSLGMQGTPGLGIQLVLPMLASTL